METKNTAIIGIWAFMIVLLILSFVRMDFLVVFFLFFVALIVTVYLTSGSDENRKTQKEFETMLQHIESKLDAQSKDLENLKKFIEK
ncbi:MAG: hypothetical protein O8C66_02220 [Candidatus Methanoperedens sp.]|nr:hypothetical protein [Candidatus Methanoperedens sp.]MCZ7369302.1 hypothetical protein [Candidatus Methanoperedens sp.]